MLKDIETSGECGVGRLFKVIKAAPTLDTLPTAYKDFFLASFQVPPTLSLLCTESF